MTAISKSIRKSEDKFDRGAERFVFRHPYLAFLFLLQLLYGVLPGNLQKLPRVK